jgi:hypothetical protein
LKWSANQVDLFKINEAFAVVAMASRLKPDVSHGRSFHRPRFVFLQGFNWLRELDLNQRPSGYEPAREMGIALKVKLYSGLKILTCKDMC